MVDEVHPAETWVEGMDEVALAEWLTRRHAFVAKAWREGDMELTRSAVDPDFTLVSKRTLGGENYQGTERYSETFSLSETFPLQSQEILILRPPNLAIVRNMLRNDDGDELATVWAMRFRNGLLAEWVVFDDEPESESLAMAELDRMAAS